eukprot:TRINITY_DN9005_c0_g7_i1.p1 TRINITY_DN9005_c0_g7~~TRINITY_DN9005_c0_g7_i1.p1  ORF type:complete len:231 (-),score=42.01 TRINITY_DN9005_c0_g7_i1:103-795(-)
MSYTALAGAETHPHPHPHSAETGMRAGIIPTASVCLGALALTLAYLQATLRGDQPRGLTHLPDITHCVLKQPERGVFLTLFMPACMGMAASWLMGATSCKYAWRLGLAACFLLVMSEAMLDAHPNWTLHTIGATGFFLLTMVAQCLRAWHPAGEGQWSLTAKRVIAVFNVCVLLLDGALSLLKQPAWTSNLCEWTLAFTVVAYHATFAHDLRHARLNLVPPTSSEASPPA